MFVLSYFTTEEESLHLALSEDGQSFYPVDDGRELLRGALGTKTLRDPFLYRTSDGIFHLLATDRWHSPDIIHASSLDLISWSEQNFIPVMRGVAGALNAWAPECFTDGQGAICLIWSSLLHPETADIPESWDNTPQDQRIWSATTTDFLSATPAEVFFDPGYSVIDASILNLGNRFLMAYKDERGSNEDPIEYKDIRLTSFTDAGDFTPASEPATPRPVEGPTMFRRSIPCDGNDLRTGPQADGAPDEEIVMLFDHFLEGRYSALSSRDEGSSWAPVDLELPPNMRHASVIHVPDADALAELVKRTALS